MTPHPQNPDGESAVTPGRGVARGQSFAAPRQNRARDRTRRPDKETAQPEDETAVLSVRDLVVRYESHDGKPFTAVNGVSLDIGPGETFGLVGETGCGKSTLARAALKLTPSQGGQVRLLGRDLAELDRRELRRMRRRCQMIFQDPRGSLDPRMSVGRIIGEPLRVHDLADRSDREARVREVMDLVGLPSELFDRRPVQLSGGQQQRVGIARALITEPALVVCDEPVSALDVSIRAQILNLLADLRDRLDVAFLFIAHDLAVVRHLSDRVGVMYLGRMVEEAPVEKLFAHPRHPYTQGLVAAILHADTGGHERLQLVERLAAGEIPSLLDPPDGCAYQTRCPYAEDVCRTTVPAIEVVADGAGGVEAVGAAAEGAAASGGAKTEVDSQPHQVACHRWPEIPAPATTLEPQS